MHDSAKKSFLLFKENYLNDLNKIKIVEIGSRSVNADIRNTLNNNFSYIGLDIEAGKNVEWVSYDHDYHGYIFPIKGDDGKYILNDVQIGAIDHVVSWLGKKFSESKL